MACGPECQHLPAFPGGIHEYTWLRQPRDLDEGHAVTFPSPHLCLTVASAGEVAGLVFLSPLQSAEALFILTVWLGMHTVGGPMYL